MPTPTITWVILALILGILVGAALNESWHTRNDRQEDDGVEGGSRLWAESTIDWPDAETVPAVAHEWGEISTRALAAARQATRQQIERWPEGAARDHYLSLHDAMPEILKGAGLYDLGAEHEQRRDVFDDISRGMAEHRSMTLAEAEEAIQTTLQADIDGARAIRRRSLLAGERPYVSRGEPRVIIFSERVAQGQPLFLDEAGFEEFVGAPRAAILQGLGFADAAG